MQLLRKREVTERLEKNASKIIVGAGIDSNPGPAVFWLALILAADDASDHPGQVQGREGEADAGEEGAGDDAPAEVPLAARGRTLRRKVTYLKVFPQAQSGLIYQSEHALCVPKVIVGVFYKLLHQPISGIICVLLPTSSCEAFGVLDKSQQRCSIWVQLIVWAMMKK